MYCQTLITLLDVLGVCTVEFLYCATVPVSSVIVARMDSATYVLQRSTELQLVPLSTTVFSSTTVLLAYRYKRFSTAVL